MSPLFQGIIQEKGLKRGLRMIEIWPITWAIVLMMAIIAGIFHALNKAEERRHQRWVQEKRLEWEIWKEAYNQQMDLMKKYSDW